MALPCLRQSVFRAELLAVVRTHEECHPKRVVNDCRGVVALCPMQKGQRRPKGTIVSHYVIKTWRAGPLLLDRSPGVVIHWMQSHQTGRDAMRMKACAFPEDLVDNKQASFQPSGGSLASCT
eukprot:2251725-Amphidinium_carterae.1